MFGINSSEMLVILVVALILIGPQKLPDLLKAFGKGVAEFRRMTTDVRTTLEREIERVDEAKRIEETKRDLFGDDSDQAAAAKTPPAEQATAEAPVQAPAAHETAEAPKPTESTTSQAGMVPPTAEKSHA